MSTASIEQHQGQSTVPFQEIVNDFVAGVISTETYMTALCRHLRGSRIRSHRLDRADSIAMPFRRSSELAGMRDGYECSPRA